MKDNPVLNFLAERRSVLARNMSGPGPDRDMLGGFYRFFACADHGKLTPVVGLSLFKMKIGKSWATLRRENLPPQMPGPKRSRRRASSFHARLVLWQSWRVRAAPENPRSEQLYSAGAVCVMLITAARAAGFAAQWLTGAAAYVVMFSNERKPRRRRDCRIYLSRFLRRKTCRTRTART